MLSIYLLYMIPVYRLQDVDIWSSSLQKHFKCYLTVVKIILISYLCLRSKVKLLLCQSERSIAINITLPCTFTDNLYKDCVTGWDDIILLCSSYTVTLPITLICNQAMEFVNIFHILKIPCSPAIRKTDG